MPPAAPLPDLDSLWDYDRPEASEAVFRSWLPAARASGDPDGLAQLLTQVARAEGLQMKFDDAWRTLDEAEASLTEATPIAKVRLLLERGRVLNSSKRRFAVDAAHMLAIVETGDASAEWNRTAIALAEGSEDPRAKRWLGSLYHNLAWARHDACQAAEALGLFEKALVARDAPDGYVREEIAECLLARREEREAALHFAAAYSALRSDPWLMRDEPERLERMRRMGGVPAAEETGSESRA